MKMQLAYNSNFGVDSCSLEITLDAVEPYSAVTYSVEQVHTQKQENDSNRYYPLSGKLKFLTLGENKTATTTLPFPFKTQQGVCSSSGTEEVLDFELGRNMLFTCHVDLDKDQFVQFCKSQDQFPVLSTFR